MTEKLIEECKKDFPLLLEAGFVAANQADEACATSLFEVAAHLRPESSAPEIGFGYIAMHKMELKTAIEHLSKAAEMDPENEVVKALLGFCHIMTEKEESVSLGSELLHALAKETEDESIKKLSETSDHVVEYIKDHQVSTPFDL